MIFTYQIAALFLVYMLSFMSNVQIKWDFTSEIYPSKEELCTESVTT